MTWKFDKSEYGIKIGVSNKKKLYCTFTDYISVKYCKSGEMNGLVV